ncbi:DUF6776 family protein [Endothiovibrio diazotrophicus]
MAKVNPSLVVKPHQPWRAWLLLALLPLLLVAVGKAALEYGRGQAAVDFVGLEGRNGELRRHLGELEEENQQLREKAVVLERAAQVDRKAYEQLRSDLDGLQKEIADLTEELAFYRSIVSPKQEGEGLRVQELLITPGGKRMFRYRLVLTQMLHHDRRVEGTVGLSVEGFEKGAAATYSFGDLGGEGSAVYGFKYFQNIEGDIRLPEGFTPTRVMVAVDPKGRRVKPFTRAFDWPAAAVSHLTREGDGSGG